ncbi:MutS-like protein [Arcicella aurantiaca]|uniref:MutS-like protein n=1 Tax=Arcicella aurantiaca TaxID=591202 RepID=A0A316DX81_9BACT|nr:DNA mismatch repair protein MutS [Arcicella aurantiaca]PWK22997.1 MutS-like protein [Arcicella aurantiaca]
MSPQQTFQNRQDTFQNLADNFQKQYNQWAIFRAILFLATIAVSYATNLFWGGNYVIPVVIIGISVFLFSVSKHLKIKYLRDKNRALTRLNEDELKRLENIFTRAETGEQFAESNHFYSSDLDIFGKQSIFKLLNRTHTFTGSAMLAEWLKFPATKSEILVRQEMVAELSSKIDFRQNLEASALLIEEVAEPTHKLFQWSNSPENEEIKKPIFQYGKYLPYLTIPLILAWAFDFLPIGYPLVMLVIHGFIGKQIYETVSNALEQTLRLTGALKAYASLSETVVNEPFTHPQLLQLQSELSEASPAIKALEDILNKLGNRANPFFMFIVGIPTLWDIQYFIKLENWKRQHRDNLSKWLLIIAQFETLNSFAGLHFANPDFVKPEISDDSIALKVTSLGHPMIRKMKRITNSIEIEGEGKTVIITGSNMSGKSTFQRTVGVNIVLALAGSVVCAEAFTCSCMQIFTSMRTQDSLEEDTSSFYAELKRLKTLIQAINSKQLAVNSYQLPIFYFLDEILKGTNSKDRHDGAKALMLQLHKTRASGFISTHDVELGDEFEKQGFVENYSFSSEVVNGDLVFDYKLRAGVCHSFNASLLMKGIGIEM